MENNTTPNFITSNFIRLFGSTEQKQKQAEKYYNLLDKTPKKIEALSGKISNFIDADTVEILDEQGNINRYRLNTGIYGAEYDAIDDKETILNNPYKYKTQVPLLEKVFNKPFNEITNEDIQNYKNYQSQIAYYNYGAGRFGQRPDGSNKSIYGHQGVLQDINGNNITELSEDMTIGDVNNHINVSYPLINPNMTSEEIDYIKNNPNEINNPNNNIINGIRAKAQDYAIQQYKQGKSAFADEDPNQIFDPNKQYNFNPEVYKGMEIQYEDLGENVYGRKSGILYNPFDYKQNTRTLASNEYQNSNLDLIKLDKLYNERRITDSIQPFKEAEQTLGQYWKDIGKSSLASINRSLYGLYKVAKDNNIPITGLWDWAIDRDIASGSIEAKDSFKYIYENPELAEMTFKLSNNVSIDYIKANEKKMNNIMDSFSKGNYLDAIGKGITAIPDVLATSVGDLTVGIAAGGVAGLATKGITSNLGKYLITRSVATGAMTTAQLGNVMNEFQINNGYEMPKERQLLAFTALALANSVDILALDKGANWLFKNTIGKQLAKDSAKFSIKEKNTIRKILVTNPVIAGGATVGEFAQENLQSSIEEYFSQNLQDARTFLQIATSDKQLVEGLLGGLVGGTATITGLTIGDTANSIKNRLSKINKQNIEQETVQPVQESNLQKIQSVINSMSTDLQTLNKADLSIDELNDIKNRNREIIQDLEESNTAINNSDLYFKVDRIMRKITLKEKMVKGESLAELMNNKDYNPEGIKDPEELLLSLYYYSDKNNAKEQQAIEELAKKINVDTSVYKDYTQVDLEAKFGDRGYYTYRDKLKYYNKTLKNKSLSKEDREKIKNEISKVESNLTRFTRSQYKKLNNIVKATYYLRQHPEKTIATYTQTAYDSSKSDTRAEAFVKREELEKYDYKNVGGIYKIIVATIKNLTDSYNIIDKNTKIETETYKKELKKLRNKLAGNIKAIKNQSKKIKDKEQKTTSKTNTEKQVSVKNKTGKDKQTQQKTISKEQDKIKKEDDKTSIKSTELVSNKTSKEKNTNTPKEEKVSVEAKSEANTAKENKLIKSKPAIKEIKNTEKELQQTIKEQEKVLENETKTEETPDNKLDLSKPITIHSGGANGADTYWSTIGEQYGVKTNHYYYNDGNSKTLPPKRNKHVTKEDYEEGKIKVTIAAKQAYGFSYASVKSPLLIRNWSQVKYADTIIAVGTMLSIGDKLTNKPNDDRTALIRQVKGGTMYAVQMAINEGKPVYVYDQVRKEWYKNITGKWERSDIPTITNNFAGIGTRELNEYGKKAIRDVFEKSFKDIDKNIEQNNTIQEPITIDEKEEIIEQEPSTYIPNEADISGIETSVKTNVNNTETKQPIEDKDLDYSEIIGYTEEELELQRNKLYNKEDIEVVLDTVYETKKAVFSDLKYNIDFAVTERDENNNPIRINNQYVKQKDKEGNIVRKKYNNYKPYLLKSGNKKSLTRSKKLYEDLISSTNNTAFDLFSNLKRVNNKEGLLDSYVTPELLVSQFDTSLQSDIGENEFKINSKLQEKEKYKQEIESLKETRDNLRETRNKIHKYIIKYHKIYNGILNNSISETKIKKAGDNLDNAIQDFNTKYKNSIDEQIIDKYDLDLENYEDLENKLEKIKEDYTNLSDKINQEYSAYNTLKDKIYEETSNIRKEIRKQTNLINSTDIQNKLKNTYITKSLNDKLENNQEEIKTIIEKLKVSNTKKSLFSMFTIDKNHPEVQKVFKDFTDTIQLNAEVSTIISRLKTEPALALLFKSIPQTIDNKELKYISKDKLNDLVDMNVIMSIDYAVSTLFAIHSNILVYNKERMESMKNPSIHGLIQSKEEVTKTAVEDKLGELIVNILGISPNKENITENEWRSIKTNLGLYAFSYALQKGYLSITKTQMRGHANESDKIKYITFVQDTTNKYDKEYLKAKYELFGLGNIINKKDLYTKPIQNKQVRIGKGYHNQEVSTLQEIAHEQARQTPYYANIESINFILENKELVKEYLGYTDDLDSIKLAEIKIEKEGKNQTIDRSIDMLEKFAEEYDMNNPIFFNTFASKNMRFFIDSNTINPQTDKLHRFLFSTVDEDVLTPFNFDNIDDKLYFTYGLGQAFGISTDKMSNENLLNLFNKLTNLSSKEIKDKFINKDKLEFNGITLKVKEVSHFLQGIQALEQYEDMITAGKNTASIKLLVENDSTTSGVAIKLLSLSLFKTYRQEMEQVGIFLNKDMTINERKENKNNLDIYQDVAKNAKRLSTLTDDEIITEYFTALYGIGIESKVSELKSILDIYQFFKPLLPEIGEDGSISDELREIFKTPVMTYFYMISPRGMVLDLSDSLSVKLFSEYVDAKNKDNLTDRDKLVIKNIEGFFNSLEVAYVKGVRKSKIKDKSILELLATYKFDDIVLHNYDMSLKELFTTTIGVLYGGTIWNALHNKYKALRGSNVLIGLVNDTFTQLLNSLYTKFNLKDKSIKEVEDFMSNMFYPSITVPYASNKYQGVVAIDKDTVFDTDSENLYTILNTDNVYTKILNKEKEFITNKSNNFKTATLGSTTGSTAFTGGTSGLPVIMTHFKDGAVINLVMSLFKNLLTVHDATVYQANLGKDIVYNYNKAFYEVVTNYNDYSAVNSTLDQAIFISNLNNIKLQKIILAGDSLDSIIALLKTEEIQSFKSNLLEPEYSIIDTLVYSYDRIQELLNEGLEKNNDEIKALKKNFELPLTQMKILLSALAKVTDYQHKTTQTNNLTISNMDGIKGTQYNNQNLEETVVSQVRDKTEQFIKDNIKMQINEDGIEEFVLSSKIKKLDPDILRYFNNTTEEDNKILETRLLTNGEERVNLFKELANKSSFKDNPFKKELKELLSSLNSLKLDKLTVELIDSIKQYGEYNIADNKIILAANETSPESRYSNPAVRYVHEIVHAVTAFALENSKKLGIDTDKNKLMYLYQLASKTIKPEDFLPETVINYEEDLKEATKIWNYVFNNNDKNYPLRGLNEFIAYALTDERIANKLKTIKIQKDKMKKPFIEVIKELISKIFKLILPSGNKSLQDNFPNLYNFLIGNTGFKNQDVHASILALVQRISIADNKALNNKIGYVESLKGIIESIKQYTYEPLNTTLSNVLKYITTVGDKTFNLNKDVIELKEKQGTFKTAELLAITAKTIGYSLISSKARNALPSVLSMYGIGSVGETFRGWGTIGRWINEIKGYDELGNRIQDYSRKARQIDQQAMQLNEFYVNMLKDSFKDKDRPNGLNEAEKVALTEVLLKTDIQSLDLDIGKIKQLLVNDNAIEKELNKQLEVIKKQSRNIEDYNYYKNSITLLAYYMNSGNINSLTTLTAKEIADKAGTSTRFQANKSLIDAINKAVTLTALKSTSLDTRQLVTSFNTDGLDFFIKAHKSYTEGASTEINSDTYIGRSKGYIKEIIDNAHDLRIGLLSDKDKMANKGFKPVSDEIIGSIGEEKLILYKDGYKYNQHRNGATFMYTGYAKLGTDMFDYIESEKELVHKDINVRHRSANIRKTVENDRVIKTKQLEKREFKLEELIKLGEKTKGILTIYDENGDIDNYSFTIPKDLSRTIGLKEDGLSIISKMNASLFRQQQSIKFNEQLFEFLTLVQNNMDKGLAINYKDNHRWVAIDNDTPDKYINNVYKTTDRQFKQLMYRYKRNNNFKPLLVREDLVLDLFGQADISLASKISRNRYIIKHVIDLAERIIKFIASSFKVLIVIKTPAVLIGNIFSNIALHALQGINPIAVIKKYITGLKHLQNYRTDNIKRNNLLIKQSTIGLTKAEESELGILNTKLKQNPVYPLISKGFLSNIVDDVTIVNYDNSSDFNTKINKLKNKLPKPLQAVIDIAFLTENTMFYQVMTKATQYSDFLARYVDYEFYMDKAKEKYKGKDLQVLESKIVDKIIENYINYDKPHSSVEQYLNDIGLVLFTKYLKRIQSVITRFAVDKPINTALFVASQLFLVDISDIFESSLLVKDLETYIYNPINNAEELLIPPISRL